jgi:outer membrane protein assembly factor BamB
VAQTWPGLTLVEDTIYVISGAPQQVYMLDAETGAQKGTYLPQGEHRGAIWWSPVAVGSSSAFAGFAESDASVAGLFAFDPETGQTQWSVPAESFIIPAPVLADTVSSSSNVVYFGASDGQFYAVDVETQAVKPGWPFQADEAIWGSSLPDDGRVYVPAMDHHLYALDAETGQEIWNRKLGGAIAAAPTLKDGILYIGAFDGRLYAIQADDGELLEGFEFQADNWIWSEVLALADRLYVTSLDGNLYALDPATGAVIPPYPYNSSEIDDTEDSIRAPAVEAGELIIIATEQGKIIAVKDGVRQWYWPSGTPEAGILTAPIVQNGTIYAVLMDGRVVTLNAESGVQGWTWAPPES